MVIQISLATMLGVYIVFLELYALSDSLLLFAKGGNRRGLSEKCLYSLILVA
jgi:hypothetical protein